STNQMNSGGGGGANWGAGGQGGRTWSANQDRGGYGGAGFTTASASRMIMGGGGGAGTRNNSSGTMSSGAAGGGIVMIRAGTFSGSGTITVNGADGIDADNDGGGGAGAGGSVLVVANSGGLGSLTINARGGVGGDAWITEPANGSPGARHGPGGGAGGGFIATNGSATTNVTGGTNGRTTTSLDAYGATAGSNGSVQSIFASDVPGADSGAQCVPVLTVTKTTSTPSVTNTASGTTATYSITVANAANRSSATNLNISDALPSGFTYSSTVSVTLNGGATRPSTTNPSVGATNPNWGVFTIPGGGSVVLTFNAAIASSVANGTYQNPATATYTDPTRTTASGTTTSNYNSGSSTAENVTVSSIDLTIAKSHTGNFQQGQTGATYSITVTNSGNIASSGTVTVTDTLPASLTATAISGTGWSCVLGTLTCTRSDALGAGASYPAITLTVNVASNAPSSVTNSATVSGGNEANTTNNTDTDPTTVTQMPDLTVNKSHSGNFTLGQTGATYSIVVTNSGSATTSGTVTMTDTLPTGLTATGISGGGWSCVLATLTCTRNSTRGPGNSFQTITVTVNVAANAPPTVTNTATVSGGGEINTSNNTDNDPTTIVQPDLTIAKSHTGNFTQGQTGAQYSLTVTNAGSASTNGTTVTVTDTLPTGLTATAITGTGWSCVLGTLTCTRTSVLTAGSSYPAITLTVDVANNAPASVTNLVTVSGGGQIYTGNDTATDPTTINQLPDLTVAKSHTGNFTQGQVGATYSITVTNSGFAATTAAVSVTDTLPASLTATDISGTGWSCVLGTLTCTRSDALANGASYPAITLTVNVSPTAPASVINSVAVSGGGQTNTSNDTATDPTTINPGVPNITLVKTVDPTGTQIPGTEIVYSVTYTNGGTAPAQNFIIIDPNPANVDPLERVFRNVDFKVGSMTSAPGTTGLVATFSYSNDGGTTWTYTPVSGGGGAPAGYDRNVTNVRWSFAGNLSQTSPNNTGGVGFTARIR
ncbi:MAG: beta strand repeat-containing protein, partial [Pyrinomonadaceae bacterium]